MNKLLFKNKTKTKKQLITCYNRFISFHSFLQCLPRNTTVDVCSQGNYSSISLRAFKMELGKCCPNIHSLFFCWNLSKELGSCRNGEDSPGQSYYSYKRKSCFFTQVSRARETGLWDFNIVKIWVILKYYSFLILPSSLPNQASLRATGVLEQSHGSILPIRLITDCWEFKVLMSSLFP